MTRVKVYLYPITIDVETDDEIDTMGFEHDLFWAIERELGADIAEFVSYYDLSED